MDSASFLQRADDIFLKLNQELHNEPGSSPAIPHGYDKITEYQMKELGLTRDQLRMAVCLESFHAGMHKESLFYQRYHGATCSDAGPLFSTLDHVRQAPSVTPHISLLECARRADGAACLILASNRFLMRRNMYTSGLPTIIGGGASSGPLYPPAHITERTYSSCKEAMVCAYASAGNLTADDIDFFGLYDCFPICLVRALEACGLCEKGQGGEYLEEQYDKMMNAIQDNQVESLLRDSSFFPVNTHGGLLCFGAPWEVPAMYNIVEATQQLQGRAVGRQIHNCRRALVYGNGGVLSASAVAILAASV
jgi:acetyl-CoA acetyltransferase